MYMFIFAVLVAALLVLFVVGLWAYADHRMHRSIDNVGLDILDEDGGPGGLPTRL